MEYKNKFLLFAYPIVSLLLFLGFSGVVLADKTGYTKGQKCAYPSDCSEYLTCDQSTFVCAVGVAGEDCDTNDDCQTGVVCVQGRCVANNGGAIPGTVPTSNNTTNPSGSGSCPTGLTQVNGLCLPASSPFSTGIAGQKTLTGLILLVISLLLDFAGIIAVVILIVGGFWYITSSGNEEQAEKGKKAIINAIIGLIVVILSYAIVSIISGTLTTTNFLAH